MKKQFALVFLAGLVTFSSSCEKETKPASESTANKEITILASGKPDIAPASKTVIDGTSVKWSESGEKLKVFEVATPAEGDVATTHATSADGVTTDGGATMSFGVSLADKSEGYSSFDYYAVYPSSAYQSDKSVNSVALNTKGTQTPTATNFDASQDLLIAKKIENGATQASTLEMQFARVVAIGKMTIKNLESTDPITKITFSAKVGEEAVALAGRTNFNLETAKPVTSYASNTQDHAIVLDYEGQNITANTSTGMVAYFTCYPFAINAETPGSFKVVVETETQSFTKEVSVSSAKGLAFNIGKGSVFSVDMDGITGETKAVDLRYAYLDYEDFSTNGGSNSYGNVTVDKTHGDSWVMYAVATNNNAIGVRRHDGQNANDSYIKLPDLKEDIKTVIVTLKNVTADKTITLETSATATEGSIASTTTTAATQYTFDLTSKSVKTAYFRCSGFQAQVEKIEVYAGTDNRVALDAPENVVAELNTDDAEVTNSIDVSWDAVAGAGSYIITLMDENADITTVVADASPYTVTNLSYEMEYLIAVKAVPADAYINNESSEVDASSSVTTGREPGGSYWEIVSSIEDITADDKYLLATNDKNNVFNGTITSGHLQVVAVSPAEGKIFDDNLPATASQITFIAATGSNKYHLKVGSKYLAATAAKSGSFALNDNAFEWTFSGTNGMNAVGTAQAAYIRSYNNNSFRSYANTSNGAVFFLYKFVDTDTRADVSLQFAEDEFGFVVHSTEYNAFVPQTATATPNVAAITSAITYSLTDPNGVVSGFNTSTGSFSLTGEIGTATITASYGGDENYKPAEDVSYTVTVKNAGGGTATFTFGDNISTTSGIINGVTLSTAKNSGANDPAFYTDQIRIYRYGSLTLSSTSNITSIVINYSSSSYVGSDTAANVGSYSCTGSVGTWTGSASSVTITNTGTSNVQMRITSIVVEYE